MGLIGAMSASASGLQAQRVRMDTVSGNVANVDTTRNAEGTGPYRRHVVHLSAAGAGPTPFSNLLQGFSGAPSQGVVVAQVSLDQTTAGREAHDPNNPDADADGNVQMPNVDLVTEMTDLTSANRSYQANVTVLNAVKQMALRALDIASR